MGTLILAAGIVAIAYILVVNAKGKPARGGRSKARGLDRVETIADRPIQLDPATLPKAWETTPGDARALRLSADVTVTLQGAVDAAREIENYLVQSRTKRFPDRAAGLAILMSRLNVEVPEIEQFRQSLLAKVRRAAAASVSAHRDIAKLRIEDPELLKDLLEEAEDEAYEKIDGRPSQWRELDELRTPRPVSLEADDSILARVNHDPRLLWVYSSCASDQAKARRIGDGESIEPWVALVDAGLAVRGGEIPPENLVTAYTLAQLNQALRPEKPLRRKAAAIPLITATRAAALPGLSRVFLIKPLDAETAHALGGFEWVRTQAALLLETVICAERAQLANLRASPGTRGANWSFYGDCCERARRLQSSDNNTGRRPSQLPPYHIGCEAYADVWIE